MAEVQRTLSIIKPDAIAAGHFGAILHRIENAGFKIMSCKMTRLSELETSRFYIEHKDKPFYKDLIKFMISGAAVIQILEGEDAIARYRDLMGHTDPAKAAPGTLRADFGTSIDRNAVHGSDSEDSAYKETKFFFGYGLLPAEDDPLDHIEED